MAPPRTSRLLLDFLPQNFRYLDTTQTFPQTETLDYLPEMGQPDGTLKRERVTLEQLAKYDDILTDVLVDHVRARPRQDSSSLAF
jgi:hypothetical protein